MITTIDYNILNFIQAHRTDFLDTIMPYITYLGEGGVLWVVMALVFLMRRKDRQVGVVMGLALITGTVICTLILKNVVGRERPFNQPQGILDAAHLLIPPPSDRYSFPSGHSLGAFAGAVPIFLYHKNFGVVNLIIATLIAFSRIYLYVHFPSDVICGTLLGIFFAIACNSIVTKNYEKWNNYYEGKLSTNIGKGNTKT